MYAYPGHTSNGTRPLLLVPYKLYAIPVPGYGYNCTHRYPAHIPVPGRYLGILEESGYKLYADTFCITRYYWSNSTAKLVQLYRVPVPQGAPKLPVLLALRPLLHLPSTMRTSPMRGRAHLRQCTTAPLRPRGFGGSARASALRSVASPARLRAPRARSRLHAALPEPRSPPPSTVTRSKVTPWSKGRHHFILSTDSSGRRCVCFRHQQPALSALKPLAQLT